MKSNVFTLLPVVELHLRCLPLLKLAGDVGGSAQYVFHVQEELLGQETNTKQQVNTKRRENLNQTKSKMSPPTFMNFSYWTADSIVLEE